MFATAYYDSSESECLPHWRCFNFSLYPPRFLELVCRMMTKHRSVVEQMIRTNPSPTVKPLFCNLRNFASMGGEEARRVSA